LQKHIEMLHMLQWLYMYVANVCFAIFQVFADAWWVSGVCFKCSKCFGLMLQLFWMLQILTLYVAHVAMKSTCCAHPLPLPSTLVLVCVGRWHRPESVWEIPKVYIL
jgi:hypothetical protein